MGWAMLSGFSTPQFSRAMRITPSPYCVTPPPTGAAAAQECTKNSSGGGGFEIASGLSGRRWHVVDAVRNCLYGEVLRAVEVVRGGFFAIKVPRQLCFTHMFVCVWGGLRYC